MSFDVKDLQRPSRLCLPLFVCCCFLPLKLHLEKQQPKEKNLIKNLYISFFFFFAAVAGFQGNLYLHLSGDAHGVHSLEKLQPLRDFEINNSFSITAKCRHYSALATCRVPLIQRETSQRQP